jgi:hypothetical protein
MPISPSELERAAKRAGAEPPKVVSDRLCVSCGYQLRGLAIGGKCPECGLPIATPGQIDEPLSLAPLHIIKRFRFGCWLAMACLVAQVGVVVAQVRWPQWPAAWAAVMLAAAIVWFIAAIWLTPAFHTPQAISWGFGQRGRLRLIARWLQVSWAAAYGVNLLNVAGATGGGGTVGSSLLEVFGGIAIVCGLAGLVVLGIVLGRLAEWARDDTAERWFNYAIWGIPIATAMLVFGAPLLAGAPLRIGWGIMLFWMVCVLAFPYALYSLSRSVMFAVHHSHDYQERLKRKHQRDAEYHDRLGAAAARTIDPSAAPRRSS